MFLSFGFPNRTVRRTDGPVLSLQSRPCPGGLFSPPKRLGRRSSLPLSPHRNEFEQQQDSANCDPSPNSPPKLGFARIPHFMFVWVVDPIDGDPSDTSHDTPRDAWSHLVAKHKAEHTRTMIFLVGHEPFGWGVPDKPRPLCLTEFVPSVCELSDSRIPNSQGTNTSCRFVRDSRTGPCFLLACRYRECCR